MQVHYGEFRGIFTPKTYLCTFYTINPRGGQKSRGAHAPLEPPRTAPLNIHHGKYTNAFVLEFDLTRKNSNTYFWECLCKVINLNWKYGVWISICVHHPKWKSIIHTSKFKTKNKCSFYIFKQYTAWNSESLILLINKLLFSVIMTIHL